MVTVSFLAAIGVGTVLLSLPISHAEGSRVNLIDALFTATSAICVTGLTVVDTGGAFSVFGQVVIMVLIKAGGLGILTLGTLLAFATGRRLGIQERLRLQAQINAQQVGGVVRLVRNLVLFTVSVEAVGTLLLYLRFEPLLGLGRGLYYALFHSISAFNNAGFALWPDNLARFVDDPLVNLTIAGLFVVGGLGAVVVFELAQRLKGHPRSALSLHSKMALGATLFLVVVGSVVVTALEWNNPGTLAGLPRPMRLLAGFFQSVSPRTAGFNTVSYGNMQSATLLFVMLLMFIGASPGSTGGGIKTVTFFVMIGSAWSLSRGRGELELFGRRIDIGTVVKAAVIATMGVLLVGAALTALALSDPDLPVLSLAFEAVSAFGTVGLSMGITPELSYGGRLILVALMFLGRVGLLTFALALVEKPQGTPVKYPAEDVVIG